jgi:hypothetical protein
MSFYGSFSARAKRAIFLAHSQALNEDAQEITPEHILSALLKEDPALFALLVPQQPNSAHKIEQLLVAAGKNSTMRKSTGAKPVLSPGSKEVVWTASEERKRLGHKSVGTQHLLLALLATQWKRKGWLRTRVRRNDSFAKPILERCGLSAESVEQKIREGIATPLTWVLDDSITKLNAQLAAIADLLISKRIFTRSEFVAILDQNADPINPEGFLVPLIEALSKKGKLTADEKDTLISVSEVRVSQGTKVADESQQPAQTTSPDKLPMPE